MQCIDFIYILVPSNHNEDFMLGCNFLQVLAFVCMFDFVMHAFISCVVCLCILGVHVCVVAVHVEPFV